MAYSMHTEAKIFTRFILYMPEQKVLKAQTYDSMFTKHSDFKYAPGEKKPAYPAYMGESLEIHETPFGKSFGHGGKISLPGNFNIAVITHIDKTVIKFVE